MRVSVKKLSIDATGGRVKAAEAWLTVWGSFGVSGCDIFSFWAVKSEALEAVASGFVCSPLHPLPNNVIFALFYHHMSVWFKLLTAQTTVH